MFYVLQNNEYTFILGRKLMKEIPKQVSKYPSHHIEKNEQFYNFITITWGYGGLWDWFHDCIGTPSSTDTDQGLRSILTSPWKNNEIQEHIRNDYR